MINQRFKYTLLLSSLPVQPAELFTSKLPVISRIQLDKRLAILDAEDTADLDRIEGLLHWSKMHEWDDATIINRGQSELNLIRSSFLRDIVSWRLELRTLLTALRRRHAGENITPSDIFYGFGDHLQFIRRNWQKPDFGLGNTLPWLKQANQLITENKPQTLDKLMLELNWKHYARLSLGHYFDFPAVALYVLRWDLINRWVSYDKDRALLRFNELISAGMADVSLEFEGKP
ncbi:DUF2764 family protein [Methylomonas lenta]|uniref:DUF2764 family protein n=1 Tax=Methylomonas lenta TaxID=980561 RepID=UPI000AB6F095|nr:DUF2764 family protein [Methylomonas lenta]